MAESSVTTEPAAPKPKESILSFACSAVNLSSESKTEILGEPVYEVWIEAIQAGDYKLSDGSNLSADMTRLRSWARKVREMSMLGIRMPVTDSEMHVVNTEAGCGRIVDAKIDGNWLSLKCQLVGDDTRKMAAKNEFSIGIVPKFTDGRGKVWSDVIRHIAITPEPIVNGQSSPQFAAQDREFQIITCSLSGATMADMNTGDTMLPCSADCMSGLTTHVPGFAGKPDPEKLPHLLQHVKKFSGIIDGVGGGLGGTGFDTNDSMYTMSLAQREAATEKTIKLSRHLVSARNEDARTGIIERIMAKKEACIDKGISPAVLDKLFLSLVGDPAKGKFNELCLSRATAMDEGTMGAALAVFSALAENSVTTTGRQTTTQNDGGAIVDYKKMAAECVASVGPAAAAGYTN